MPMPKTAPSALEAVFEAADRVILGKGREIRLAICCLLAGGHLLIEDLPGVGKTTLAQLLARLLGLALLAHPVHQRPAPGGHHRGLGLRAQQRDLPLPPRPHLRPGGPGR